MEERSDELMSLMLEEWNMEDALKYSKQEGIEEGMEKGIEKGMKNGMVYAYYEMNLDTNEIAEKCSLQKQRFLKSSGRKIYTKKAVSSMVI